MCLYTVVLTLPRLVQSINLMPLLSAGWLSGYAVTNFVGLTRRLSSRSLPATSVSTKISGLLPTSHASTNGSGKEKVAALSGCATQTKTSGSIKPPNVLIYTGPDDTDEKKYSCLKKALAQVLNLHSYVIYRLHEKTITTHPWMENTALLVLGHDNSISDSVQEILVQHVRDGGKLLGLSSSFTCQVIKKPWNGKDKPFPVSVEIVNAMISDGQSSHLTALCEPFYFEVPEGGQTTVIAREENTKRPVIVQMSEGHGTAFFSLLHLELNAEDKEIQNKESHSQNLNLLKHSNEARIHLLSRILQLLGMKCLSSEIPELTPVFLLASKRDEQNLLHSLKSSLKGGVCKGKDLSLCFVPIYGENIPETTENILPVLTGIDNTREIPFNWRSYQDQLQSNVLGKVVFYTPVITSTQTVFDGNFTFVQNIPEDIGVVVVASQQVKGQGRGGNMWLSPVGCMMFSLHVRIPFGTELGSRPPYLQHIASLAVVEAITSFPGYKDIDIRLKWPNDIYFGKDRKIGGVIVTSSTIGGTLSAVIGMGVNVANSEPTVSVNEIISQHNKQNKTNLQPVTIEVLLARTINLIEATIDEFQEHGTKKFLKKYYSRWLHSDATVSLDNGAGLEEVQIKGLDNFGFLLVQKQSGELCSLQPDGNSFDMLRNLIAIKQN